jgi:hypothetical protein
VCNVLAAIGDASLVGGVIFLGSDFADNLGVGDLGKKTGKLVGSLVGEQSGA